jgi:branched-chain amino acid transport system substrate-binding protein
MILSNFLRCPLALVFTFGIVAYSQPLSAAEPIRVGVAAPFTGSQAKIGTDMLQGAELAVAEWNARGGIRGRSIEIVKGDDEASPKQAPIIARELIGRKVAGVVGHFNSGCTIPASEIYDEAGVVMITPAATNPKVTDRGYKGVFRVCGRDDQQGGIAGRFAADVLKVKRVAILHDKTTYGQGLADEFKKAIETRGIRPVYYAGVPQQELDFRAIITAIRETKPDLWYFGGIYDQGGLLLTQARQAGLTAPLMSGDGLIDQELIKTAGKAAEGTYLTFGPDPTRAQSAKAFLDTYHAKYGPHGPYAIYGYDAMDIFLQAVEKTGSTDFNKLTACLHTHEFQTAMGPLRFDKKGDITSSYYVMWVVKNGKFVLYEDVAK